MQDAEQDMDNYIAVTKGFKILLQVMAPYIAQEMRAAYGDNWWNIGVMEKLYEDQQYGLPSSGDDDTLIGALDEQRCLLLMEINWKEVFGRKLPRECKSWVMELKGNRNDWAHAGAGEIDEAKASRMLDTMQLLCAYMDAERAEEIAELLREVRYGSAEGSVAAPSQAVKTDGAKPRKDLAATIGAKDLPSWRTIIEPHPDVAQGRYQNAEFAADLAQVARGEGSIEYRDPVEFFARTYITQGMENLLVQAILRVSGQGGEPVVRLKTAFGGGKTHSMLALYHLLRGNVPLAKIPSVQPVLEKAGVQAVVEGVHVAVLVGTALNPAQSSRPANMPGITVNTLWGEMAYQIALSAGDPTLYNYVKEADKKHVAPGSKALTDLFDACGPCLVLVDELVAYARKLEGGKDLPAGDFGNLLTFIQELTEAARASKNSMVVASIPDSDIEIGGEAGQKALDAIEHTFGRMESIWKPVAASEGFEVVRRRLFQDCKDEEKRDAVCESFSAMYNAEAADFPVEAKSLDYKESMRSCYPIHPEVFDRLYEDWATLQAFQRTRGVLRLMAAVIHDLWMNQDESPMILPGSFPLSNPTVRDELTRYLPEAWNGIVDSEIDGKKSVPYRNDENNSRYGCLLASRRTARTIMLGSAPDVAGQTARGLDKTRIRLGTVQPGENIAVFNDALNELKLKSSYLYSDANDSRYWYDTRPTLRKTVDDRVQQTPDDAAYFEIETRLKKLTKSQPLQGVHACPSSSSDVPDEQGLRLVVLPPHEAHRAQSTESPALSVAKEILAGRGTTPRQYKNMLVFVATDNSSLASLKDESKQYLAWCSVQDDREVLNLDAAQDRETKQSISRSDSALETKILEAYSWTLCPRIDLETDSTEIIWDESRVTGGSQDLVERVNKKLQADEAIIAQWAPALLKRELDKVLWKNDDCIQVKLLWQDLCSYCYLPRLASYEVLQRAIAEGLTSKSYFGIAGDKDNEKYLDLQLGDGARPINLSDYLVKVEAAQKQLDEEKEAEPLNAEGANAESEGELGVVGGGNASPSPGVTEEPQVTDTPVTFHLSSKIDALHVTKEIDQIVDEIISNLEHANDCETLISLEVSAHVDEGFDDATVRTVTENCKTLHIDDYGFTQ